MAAKTGGQGPIMPLWPLLRRLWRPNAISQTPDNELYELADQCDSWEHRCGSVVIFGLIIDVAIAIWNPPWGSPEERWAPVVATIFVAIGVYGEIAFGNASSGFRKELLRRSNDRLATAESRAHAAEQSAGVARTDAMTAKTAIASAEDRARKERETK